MSGRLFNRPRSNKVHYAILGLMIVALVILGYRLGGLLSPALGGYANAPANDTVASAPSTSTGGTAIVEPPYQLTDFTLTAHTGEPVKLSDFRGKAVMLFFGYTNCPDVCPTTLQDYTLVKEALGEQADDVAFVFIGVDSKRDTPQAIAEYLRQYDPDFVGMTGSEETLRRMGREYNLYFTTGNVNVDHEHDDTHAIDQDDENYFIQHTSPSFLIDRAGYLRQLFFYGVEPQNMVAGIRGILQTTAQ